MGICQYQYTMFVGEVLGTCENFQVAKDDWILRVGNR